MALLIAGLLLFFVPHFISIFKPARSGWVEKLGATPYKIGYTLLSIAGLVLLVIGYGQLRASGNNVLLYSSPEFFRHIAMLLMVFVFILFAASSLNGKIKTAVVHPQIAAVKIWAFAHLLVNGDLASVLVFGSFLAWAVISRIAYKRQGLMSVSNPVSGWVRNDWIAVIGGVLVYLVFMIWLHKLLIGVPVVG